MSKKEATKGATIRVRVPVALRDKLAKAALREHYTDVSEFLRERYRDIVNEYEAAHPGCFADMKPAKRGRKLRPINVTSVINAADGADEIVKNLAALSPKGNEAGADEHSGKDPSRGKTHLGQPGTNA